MRTAELRAPPPGHLSAMVEASTDAIISKTVGGTILSWNPGAERLYGYSEVEAVGKQISMLVPAGHEDEVDALLARVGRGESVERFATARRRKDGAVVEVSLTISAMRDAAGQVAGAVTIARDITEQKRGEAAVAQARADIDSFFGLSLDGMAIANDAGHFVRVNPAFERTLGYSLEELTGIPFAEFVHPDDLESTLAVYARLLAGEAAVGFLNRYRCKDGSYRWLLWNASSTPGGFVYCTARDITERKRMEQELRASQRRLAMAQQVAGVGTWDWNVATGAIFWSPEMEGIYGLRPGGFEGKYESWSRTVHADDLPSAELALGQAVATQTDWHQHFRIARADGVERWIAASGKPYIDDDGECHVIGVNLDVTDQTLAEQKLEEAARFFELSSDMICTTGFDGSVKLLNGRWQQTLGWTADDLRSMPITDCVHPDDLKHTERERQKLSDGAQTIGFINRYHTKAGGWKWLEWESTAVLEKGLIYSSARDITSRIEGEAIIRRAQHEAARSRDEALEASAMKSAFLANMSHEVRTPLSGVIGMAQLLLDSPLDPEQLEHARLIVSAGETLVAVVDDILDLSKIEAGAMRLEGVELDLLETVEDACDLIADTAQRKGVELTLDLDPELPVKVRGDALRLRQIIFNLLSNAVKFTARGEIRVSLQVLDVGPSATTVRFEVADTGTGIEQRRLAQMFEPFTQEDVSTTRHFGGSGLGLAIVKQLVELMDGRVGVTSERGQGSTFWFTLPLERGEETQETLADGPPAGTRLLVVDDHETSRRLLVQLADRWEMPVTAVSDAAGALTCLREAAAREQPFDCAALTMQMPDLGGIELAALIRLDRTFPTPALVMLTGTSDQRRLAREAGIEIHLTKPVRRSRFTSALTAALGIRDRRDELAAVPELSACEVGAPLVLVAEDNELNQILAVRMLERRGYRTEVADNGRQALAMLERQRYAAVLMDCQMPELSGYDTTQQLRQREQGRAGTPVIAMTAGVLRGDREQCLASGMDDYLTKPIKPAELDRLLRRWAPKIGQHCPSPRSREWNWPGLDRSDVDRDLPT